MGPSNRRKRRARPVADARAASGPIAADSDQTAAHAQATGGRGERHKRRPVVPDVGQYELSFVYVGASNYRRQYRIFSTNCDSIYKQDFVSEVFFRQHPDAGGNMCSPIATVFQSASFIAALEELALQAEVVRARQLLVTQPQQRTNGNQNLDPANLFFDSESRAVQASATAEDDAAQAQGARDAGQDDADDQSAPDDQRRRPQPRRRRVGRALARAAAAAAAPLRLSR